MSHTIISILDYPRQLFADSAVNYLKTLTPEKDGVILAYKGNISTFLPEVWKLLPDPKMFLDKLCEKQNAPSQCWQEKDAILYTYTVYSFEEPAAEL